MKILALFALLVTPGSAGVLTKPCLMVKVSARGGDTWKCRVDAEDNDGRANHKFDILGLGNEQLSSAVSGETLMVAEGATLFGRTLDVSGADVSFTTPLEKNQTPKTVGVRTALVIRILTNDDANPFNTAADLIDNVFTDAVNMKERFSSCSYNKLRFDAFVGNLNGNDITDGLYEVQVQENSNGLDEGELEELVIDQLNIDLGNNFVDQVDHVMMFAPRNIGEFGANAEFNGKLSFYDGFEASFASVTLVHEIGHNLHLDHSSEDDDEYGDDTCSMGYGENLDDFRVCFNPPKSWALGWYSDKQETLDVSAGGTVVERNLVGIAEYLVAGSNSLFLKLDNGGDDYYLGFNRAVGINVDQIEAIDQVTVTQSSGSTEFSFLLAKLSSGESFTIDNIKGSGTSIEIEVLSVDLSSVPSVASVRVTNTADGGPGPTPTPPTSSPAPGPACFSGSSSVMVRGKGDVSMSALEIGDFVLAAGGYSKVWGFLHRHENLPAQYLQVKVTGESLSSQLEVSAEHLVYANGKPVAAGELLVGQAVDGFNGEPLVITAIQEVQRRGVYAPATESGDIIVGGVRSSNYVNLLASSSINQHSMSHAFVTPLRKVCELGLCYDDQYTEEGFSENIKFFIHLSSWLNQCPGFIRYSATVLVAPLVAVLLLLAIMMNYVGITGLAATFFTFSLWGKWQKRGTPTKKVMKLY